MIASQKNVTHFRVITKAETLITTEATEQKELSDLCMHWKIQRSILYEEMSKSSSTDLLFKAGCNDPF